MTTRTATHYFVVVNLCTFVLFGYDKSQAIVGGWRVPEHRLWFASAAGGWFGAKSGQYFFRHKTRKQPFGTLLNLVPVGWILLCESVRPGLTWALLTQRLSLDEVGAEMKQRVSKILQSAAHGSLVDTLHHKLTELQSDLSSTCKKGVKAARDATVAAGRLLRSVPASLQSLQRAGEAAKENMSLAAQRARKVLNEKWNAFQATKRDKKELKEL